MTDFGFVDENMMHHQGGLFYAKVHPKGHRPYKGPFHVATYVHLDAHAYASHHFVERTILSKMDHVQKYNNERGADTLFTSPFFIVPDRMIKEQESPIFKGTFEHEWDAFRTLSEAPLREAEYLFDIRGELSPCTVISVSLSPDKLFSDQSSSFSCNLKNQLDLFSRLVQNQDQKGVGGRIHEWSMHEKYAQIKSDLHLLTGYYRAGAYRDVDLLERKLFSLLVEDYNYAKECYEKYLSDGITRLIA